MKASTLSTTFLCIAILLIFFWNRKDHKIINDRINAIELQENQVNQYELLQETTGDKMRYYRMIVYGNQFKECDWHIIDTIKIDADKLYIKTKTP